MTEHEKESSEAKAGTQQEEGGEETGVSTDVVLGAGLGFLHLLVSDEDEKREEKRWHEQREKDEAEARNEARKAGSDYGLEDGQPYVPKMPYPVPKDWDWRRVKREEEGRRDEDERREEDERRGEDERRVEDERWDKEEAGECVQDKWEGNRLRKARRGRERSV